MEPNGKRAVPLLGVREYTCKRGHTYQGMQPWRYTLQIAPAGVPNNMLMSPPMCPWCFLDAMAFRFPSWRADKTQEQAVTDGDLAPQTLDSFGGA